MNFWLAVASWVETNDPITFWEETRHDELMGWHSNYSDAKLIGSNSNMESPSITKSDHFYNEGVVFGLTR